MYLLDSFWSPNNLKRIRNILRLHSREIWFLYLSFCKTILILKFILSRVKMIKKYYEVYVCKSSQNFKNHCISPCRPVKLLLTSNKVMWPRVVSTPKFVKQNVQIRRANVHSVAMVTSATNLWTVLLKVNNLL